MTFNLFDVGGPRLRSAEGVYTLVRVDADPPGAQASDWAFWSEKNPYNILWIWRVFLQSRTSWDGDRFVIFDGFRYAGLLLTPEEVVEVARFVDPDCEYVLATAEHRRLLRVGAVMQRMASIYDEHAALCSRLKRPAASSRLREVEKKLAGCFEALRLLVGLSEDQAELLHRLSRSDSKWESVRIGETRRLLDTVRAVTEE